METNVNYTIVGVFVIALISAVVVCILWLSSGLRVESNNIYKVYMEESVSGLNVDAPVEFNGVNVGTVRSIQLSHKDLQTVELLLNLKGSTPISQGTKAMMNSRGLTGIAFIALQDKGTDPRPVKILPDEQYPVIATSPSLFLRLDSAFSKLNNSIHDVSVSLQSLLDKDNLHAFKSILRNLRDVTSQIQPLLLNSSTTLHQVNTRTLPAANQAMLDLDNVISNMSAITLEIKRNPAMLIRGKENPPLGPGEK